MVKKLFFAVLLFILAFNFSAAAQDPWIIKVYQELYYRQPDKWELNIYNYNLGSWNNYSELKTYVQQYKNSMNSQGYSERTTRISTYQSATVFYKGGLPVASALISNSSGSLVGNDGASLIGNDSAGLIGIDGGTLKNLPIVSFGDVGTKVTFGSGNRVVKTSGRGALVMKQK